MFSNVTVIDGTGSAPFVGDVETEGQRIKSVRPTDAEGCGLALAPGFELAKAEAGHPMWGPVFIEEKAALAH